MQSTIPLRNLAPAPAQTPNPPPYVSVASQVTNVPLTPAPQRERRRWWIGLNVPRPDGNLLLRSFERRAAIGSSVAYLLAQGGLGAWDILTAAPGTSRAAAAALWGATQGGPALANVVCGTEGLAVLLELLGLPFYPIGMSLAAGAVAGLEAVARPLENALRMRLGTSASTRKWINGLQLLGTVGGLAGGRLLERAAGIHNWPGTLAHERAAVPDGCYGWPSVDAAPITALCVSDGAAMHVVCADALGGCTASPLSGVPHYRDLNMSLSDSVPFVTLMVNTTANDAAPAMTAATWLRNFSDWQAQPALGGPMPRLLDSFIGSALLGTIAMDTSLANATLVGAYADAAIRVQPDLLAPDRSLAELRRIYETLVSPQNARSMLTRVAKGEALTQTVLAAPPCPGYDGFLPYQAVQRAYFDGTRAYVGEDNLLGVTLKRYVLSYYDPKAYENYVENESLNAVENCSLAVGNLGIQLAPDVKPLTNLSAYGLGFNTYFSGCGRNHIPFTNLDDSVFDPRGALAQALTGAWSTPVESVCIPANYLRNDCPDKAGPADFTAWRATLGTNLANAGVDNETSASLQGAWDTMNEAMRSIFSDRRISGLNPVSEPKAQATQVCCQFGSCNT